MKLVVTGKTGQVATALLAAGRHQDIDVLAIGRPEFDLSNPDAGLASLAGLAPDIIVSAAAYTAVDKAENDSDEALRVNARGPGALGDLAAALGVPIIHLSTDYVYDGRKGGAYVESDPTNPVSVYGATKLAGEQAIEAATRNHVILRTAWVYSPFGNNFLKTMLKLAATKPELRVVDDQHGNPTAALDIADAVIAIAKNLLLRPDDAGLRGIFHLAGTGATTWADFAAEIFAASADHGGPSASVIRIPSSEYPTLARRPTNSCLATEKLQAIYGVSLPAWQISTRENVRLLLRRRDGK